MENEVQEPAPKYGFISQEEYLKMERKAEQKHEYYNGEVFAMSGTSFPHNKIASNIGRIIYPKIDRKGCDLFGSDLRIHIPQNTLYTYPDFSIICGEPKLTDEKVKDTVTNPSVLIEILSPSTKNYDTGQKAAFYRAIPSLQEYIVIDSSKVYAAIYIRQSDTSWLLKEYFSLTDMLFIQTIAVSTPLSAIYKDVPLTD